MENLRNSKAIMDARSGAGAYRAAVVTSDYHVFRTAEYAHKIGLAADGVGSRTARYFWPTAFIREYVAVSNAHRWPSSCSGSLSPPSRCSSCNALRARARRRTA